MPTPRELMRLSQQFLADGRVDGREVEALSEMIYADGVVDREEAEFLIGLHRRAERVGPGFEKFFYQAIKDHVLADGVIDAEEAAWLRGMIFADGRVSERERKLVRELRGEAVWACPEFEALVADCLSGDGRYPRGES